jgi:hypothetical protein
VSLLPREATFGEEVADYFLAFKGSGVALSALDAELVLQWEERAIPMEVVCRGIRKAAEQRRRNSRPSDAALRSLRACEQSVEDEFRRYRGLAAGKTATSPKAVQDGSVARVKKAEGALQRARRMASPPLRRAIDRVLPLAEAKVESPIEAAARVAYLDEALALCYLRALPIADRIELTRKLRETLAATLRAKSPRARRAALRAHRVMQAREHGKLPALQ